MSPSGAELLPCPSEEITAGNIDLPGSVPVWSGDIGDRYRDGGEKLVMSRVISGPGEKSAYAVVGLFETV